MGIILNVLAVLGMIGAILYQRLDHTSAWSP